MKVEWEEKGVIGDTDPMVLIRNECQRVWPARREAFSINLGAAAAYLEEFEGQNGSQISQCVANYPLLKGADQNLFKCFLPLSWRVAQNKGARVSFIREGLRRPEGGALREVLYGRLRNHFPI